MKKIAHGAEAIIYIDKILNKDVCIKKRCSKNYRNKILDKKIIKLRNKEESIILNKVKSIGLNTPYIYYISKNIIIMDFLKNEKTHFKKLKEIGENIAKLHNKNIIHGDLNLINIIIYKDKIYFIDFGLGYFSLKIEDKATDLLVFKKTLKSLKKTESFWEKIKEGYLHKTNNKKIIKQIEVIEKRGRYL